MKILSYKDLIVWQKSIILVESIYLITKKFPKEEVYGLIQQMRRSAVSIPSNIAEGSMRGSKKDYRHFLQISKGSAAELNTQLEISLRLEYIDEEIFERGQDKITEILKMLSAIISKFSTNP